MRSFSDIQENITAFKSKQRKMYRHQEPGVRSVIDLMYKGLVLASYQLAHVPRKPGTRRMAGDDMERYDSGKHGIVKMMSLISINKALLSTLGVKSWPQKLAYKRYHHVSAYDEDAIKKDACGAVSYYRSQRLYATTFNRATHRYLIMPWVGNMDMFTFIERIATTNPSNRVDVAIIHEVMYRVCAALKHIHDTRGPHGDVKPENVRLTVGKDHRVSSAAMVDLGNSDPETLDLTLQYLPKAPRNAFVKSGMTAPIRISKQLDFECLAVSFGVLAYYSGYEDCIGMSSSQVSYNNKTISCYEPFIVKCEEGDQNAEYACMQYVFTQLQRGKNPYQSPSDELQVMIKNWQPKKIETEAEPPPKKKLRKTLPENGEGAESDETAAASDGAYAITGP